MAWSGYVNQAGLPVYLDGDAQVAVVPLASTMDEGPLTQVISVAGTVQVLRGTAASIAGQLGIMPGGGALPVPQNISGPTLLSGPDAYFRLGGSIPEVSLFQLPNDPQPYSTVTYFVGTSTVVVGDPVTVTTILTPPPFPPGGPQGVIGWAIVLGNGTIAFSWGAIQAGPYVAGSGEYHFTTNPNLGPVGALVTQYQNPPKEVVFGVTSPGPGYIDVTGYVIGGGGWGDWAFVVAILGV